MRSKLRLLPVAALALAVAAPSAVAAQQGERDQRQEERLREAERKAELALEQLRKALAEMQGARGAEARAELEGAMEALRDAQRELGPEFYRGAIALQNVLPRVMVMAGRPRMGIEVRTGPLSGGDSLGAEIMSVTPDGPAQEAGLRAGDVISRVNGQSVIRVGTRGRDPGNALIEILREREAGDSVDVQYRRNDQTVTTTVVLRELPNTFSYRVTADRPGAIGGVRVSPDVGFVTPELGQVRAFARLFESGWLDMELVTLNAELGAYFGTSEGLLVLRAPEDGTLNLQSGDVILSIDGREPKSPSHALRIIRSYEGGESFDLEIMRQKRRLTVTAVVPDREDELLHWRERRER